MALFGSLFKQGSGDVRPAEWADMHLVLGASCQELPAITNKDAEFTSGANSTIEENHHHDCNTQFAIIVSGGHVARRRPRARGQRDVAGLDSASK